MKIYRMPAVVKTIIFDIDSTLYTHEAYAREQVDVQIRRFAALQGMRLAAAHAHIDAFRSKWRREHGQEVSFGNTMCAFGIPLEMSISWRKRFLNPFDFLSEDVHLQKVLELLAKRFSLIAVTNNPVEPADKTLKALGVRDLFVDIIGLDTCMVSKPHSKPFQRAAEQTHVSCEECVAVGDRYDIDLSAPLELGMGAVLVDGVCDVYDFESIIPKN